MREDTAGPFGERAPGESPSRVQAGALGDEGKVSPHAEAARSETVAEQNGRSAYEWQVVFDALRDAIWILDADQRVVRFNRAAERFVQRPGGFRTGVHCWEIVHGATGPIPDCPFLRMRRSLRRESVDLEVHDSRFEATTDPILDGEGCLAGAVHIVSDVTERARAEEQLRWKSERLSLLLEIGETMAGLHETSRLLQTITDGATRLSSLDAAAIYLLREGMLHLGATTPMLPAEFPEDLRVAPLLDHPHIHRVVQTGAPVILADCREADLTDAERYASVRPGLRSVAYLPLVLQDHSLGVLIVGSTGGLYRFSDEDIDLLQTLAHHAALELEEARLSEENQRWIADLERLSELQQQTQAALEQSEALFRSLFQDHAAVKLLVDPVDGRIVAANKAAAEFYGWPQEQLSRMKTWDIDTLPPDQVRAQIEAVRAGERFFSELQHSLADGSVRDVAVYTSRIEAGGKDLLHSVIHDVTDRKRAERRMAEQLSELRRWHAVMLDREGRVLELKREVNELLALAGQPPRYESAGKTDD